MEKYRKIIAAILLGSGCSLLGCASEAPPPPPVELENGVAPHVWEEPMVDVIDVPPGLDPEGHYYRPTHQEVVEIKQGRWQYYKNKEK